MPYRRLPNTDQARLRAIEALMEKGKRTSIPELGFSQQSLEKLQFFYPKFLGAVRQLQASKQTQFDRSGEYGEIIKKARLYISHFIQVLHFCVIREEMKPEVREFYGLPSHSQSIPPLNLEDDLLRWGAQIIQGEQNRCMKGGSPIYSPSIALVKVHFENFKTSFQQQKVLQNNVNRAATTMEQMRDEADRMIQSVWNEVEAKYAYLPDDLRRGKTESYGLVYVFRANEKKRVDAEKLQQSIFFN